VDGGAHVAGARPVAHAGIARRFEVNAGARPADQRACALSGTTTRRDVSHGHAGLAIVRMPGLIG